MTATKANLDFADYVAREWLTINCDDRGWYMTHDVAWVVRKLASEGWRVRLTGETELRADDTVKTYFVLA